MLKQEQHVLSRAFYFGEVKDIGRMLEKFGIYPTVFFDLKRVVVNFKRDSFGKEQL
jgi:hypothetical protein